MELTYKKVPKQDWTQKSKRLWNKSYYSQLIYNKYLKQQNCAFLHFHNHHHNSKRKETKFSKYSNKLDKSGATTSLTNVGKRNKLKKIGVSHKIQSCIHTRSNTVFNRCRTGLNVLEKQQFHASPTWTFSVAKNTISDYFSMTHVYQWHIRCLTLPKDLYLWYDPAGP